MKRVVLLVLVVALVICLSACAFFEEKIDPAAGVDTENKSVTIGTHVYRYTLLGDTRNWELTIWYPDGSCYITNPYQNDSNITTWNGGSDYAEAKDLAAMIRRAEGLDVKREPRPILLPLLLLGTGIFCIAKPYESWWLSHGWRYKNAEPSEAALHMSRLGGVAVILIAVFIYVF